MTDWDNIDKTSRELICHMLSATSLSSSFTDIYESKGNCVWDISCMHNGFETTIEVKDRSFGSDKFGDVFAEAIKQDCTMKNYNVSRAYAINVFTDGIIAMANLYDKNAKRFSKWCPKTTLCDDSHEYVKKECLSLPQTVRIKFWKDSDGEYKFKRAAV